MLRKLSQLSAAMIDGRLLKVVGLTSSVGRWTSSSDTARDDGAGL